MNFRAAGHVKRLDNLSKLRGRFFFLLSLRKPAPYFFAHKSTSDPS